MKNTIKDPEVIAKIHQCIIRLPEGSVPSREAVLAHIIDQMDANDGLLIGRLPIFVAPNSDEEK